MKIPSFNIQYFAITLLVELIILNIILLIASGNGVIVAGQVELWLLPVSAVLIPVASGLIGTRRRY